MAPLCMRRIFKHGGMKEEWLEENFSRVKYFFKVLVHLYSHSPSPLVSSVLSSGVVELSAFAQPV